VWKKLKKWFFEFKTNVNFINIAPELITISEHEIFMFLLERRFIPVVLNF